jgi:hypothetical protein
MITRRLFVASVASALAAPAIVRASSLMPVRKLVGIYHEVPIYEVYGRSPAMDALPMLQELARMRGIIERAYFDDLFRIMTRVNFDRSAFGTGALLFEDKTVRHVPLRELFDVAG